MNITITVTEKEYRALSTACVVLYNDENRDKNHGGNPYRGLHAKITEQYIEQKHKYRIGDEVLLTSDTWVKINAYCYIHPEQDRYWAITDKGEQFEVGLDDIQKGQDW